MNQIFKKSAAEGGGGGEYRDKGGKFQNLETAHERWNDPATKQNGYAD